jgi:hypothetical protein
MEDDGRSELVRLTAKGLAVVDRVIAGIARIVQQVAVESGLTDLETTILTSPCGSC